MRNELKHKTKGTVLVCFTYDNSKQHLFNQYRSNDQFGLILPTRTSLLPLTGISDVDGWGGRGISDAQTSHSMQAEGGSL